MGVVVSYVGRKINRFNIENRTHRFLEREKLASAPKYKGNIEDLKRALEMDPKLVEKLNRKDAALNDRLKSVYVTSEDRFIDFASQRRHHDPERPLPLDRKTPEDFEYGHREPRTIPVGKCSLRQAFKFITDHQSDPNHWTIKRIADEYKIKEDTVKNILFYFRPFNIHIPDKRMKDQILTQSKQKLFKDTEPKDST